MDRTFITVDSHRCQLVIPTDNPTSSHRVGQLIESLDEVLLRMPFPEKLLVDPTRPCQLPADEEALSHITRSLASSVALTQSDKAKTPYQGWCINIRFVAKQLEQDYIGRALQEISDQHGRTFQKLLPDERLGFVLAVHLEQVRASLADGDQRRKELTDHVNFLAKALTHRHLEEDVWLERIHHSAVGTARYIDLI